MYCFDLPFVLLELYIEIHYINKYIYIWGLLDAVKGLNVVNVV